jgi:hypothetical protein
MKQVYSNKHNMGRVLRQGWSKPDPKHPPAKLTSVNVHFFEDDDDDEGVFTIFTIAPFHVGR